MNRLKIFFEKLPAQTSLLSLLVTGLVLTLLLGGVVYGQVSILTRGKEIVLKTVPIDPRDLFRGYYVRLNYEISSLNSCRVRLPEKVKRNQTVYVALEKKGKDLAWKAVAASLRREKLPENTVIVRGRARYRFQQRAGSQRRRKSCPSLGLHYGIEKYFVPQKRAQRLEKMRFGDQKAISALHRKIGQERKALNRRIRDLKRQERVVNIEMDKEVIARRGRIQEYLKQSRQTLEKTRKRISVIARVSSAGDIAISGLKIDEQMLYEEPLW